MTTYTVNFASDAEFASRSFDAETPEQALALARKLYEDEPSELWFEPYNGMDVNEIAVCDPDGDKLAVWLDDELRLRLAAQEMLDALEQALAALNQAPRFKVPGLNTDSYRIAAICDKAIAKAKGGAA
ncbi:MAG TPA: hypothetical protein VNZ53_50040 [Steroidobacteraceae bacterium]|nr:hypothetical protein [Steroidobacteraceae bacterium]